MHEFSVDKIHVKRCKPWRACLSQFKIWHFDNILIYVLQELDLDKGFNLVKRFINIVKDVVNAIEKGVEIFRSILNSDVSMNDLVQEFAEALEELPNTVSIYFRHRK